MKPAALLLALFAGLAQVMAEDNWNSFGGIKSTHTGNKFAANSEMEYFVGGVYR